MRYTGEALSEIFNFVLISFPHSYHSYWYKYLMERKKTTSKEFKFLNNFGKIMIMIFSKTIRLNASKCAHALLVLALRFYSQFRRKGEGNGDKRPEMAKTFKWTEKKKTVQSVPMYNKKRMWPTDKQILDVTFWVL